MIVEERQAQSVSPLLLLDMLDKLRQAAERLFCKCFGILRQVGPLAHDVLDQPFQQSVAAGVVGKPVTGPFNGLL